MPAAARVPAPGPVLGCPAMASTTFQELLDNLLRTQKILWFALTAVVPFYGLAAYWMVSSGLALDFGSGITLIGPVFYGLGATLAAADRHEEAASVFRELLEMVPHVAEVHLNLADSLRATCARRRVWSC